MIDEGRLLVEIARGELAPASTDDLRVRIVEGAFLWPRFFELAISHRVAYLVGRNLDRYELYPPEYRPGTLSLYKNPLRLLYTGNQERNRRLAAELAEVIDTLDAAGVPVVLRKGLALLQLVYADIGVRNVSDFDLMVLPEAAPAAQDALATLGYRPAVPSADGRGLEPVPRSVEMFQRMYLPNVTLFRAGDSTFVDWFKVDLALDMFLPTSEWRRPSEDLERRSEQADVFGATVRVLRPDEMLLDLCTHLYKEATNLMFVNRGKDLCLYKFVDIVELVDRRFDWSAFIATVEKAGVATPVYFTLHHVALLYGSVIPEDVLARLRPAELDFLDEVGADEGLKYRWEMPFPERMFDLERWRQVPESRVPIHD